MDHTIIFAFNKLSLNSAPASSTANNNFNSDFTMMPSNKNSFFPTQQIISPPPSPDYQQHPIQFHYLQQHQQQQLLQEQEMHLQENCNGENAITHESLGESPSALVKKFRNNPWVTKFINELAIQESFNPNVISALLQTIYYDGANSLAIPHSYSQPQCHSKDIVRIIETWLTENFSRADDIIPILGNTLEDNVESINQRLRTELDFSGLNKVLVNIRAGHSFFSHMEGDEIVLDKNQVEFFSRFPLFVTIFIKVEAKSTYTTNEEKCQVLVAVEHVTKKTQFASPLSSALNNNNNNNNNNDLITLSPDGQILCSLEEMSNNYHCY